MSCNTQTRNLGPRNILLGKDTFQAGCITTVADVSASLQNKYIVMHEAGTQAKHYFWFNVATLGVDPAVPNATGHAVAIASGATASAVAAALAAVIDPLTWISATASTNHISYTYTTTYGYAYEARDSTVDLNKTGFTLTTSKFGSVQVDLGGTEGDVTMTVEEQNVEVKSPQTGNFILAEIRQGASLGVSFSLQDTSVESIRRAMNFYGSTIVPDNGSGAVLTGYGSSNLFKSTDDVTTQLVLRPSSLAGIPDRSQDFTMPKAKLKLGELTFSAENILVLPIEAVAYLDTTDNSYLNLFSYGDKTAL